MENFLYQIANHYYKEANKQIGNYCFVFPGRRSSLFFSKHLSSLLAEPIWAPVSLPVSDFISRFSPLQKADSISLIFDLYTVYKELKKDPEPFEDFFGWGEMMLNDFDDIDKYLVPTEMLFKNLSDLKNMEDRFEYLNSEQIAVIKSFWQNFNPDKQSEEKKDFLSLWNILHPLYNQFKINLFEKGIGYDGMIYRSVVESLQKPGTPKPAWTKIVIVGLNALNKAEKKILQTISNLINTEFIWDFDPLYAKDKGDESHEAGRFIRENRKLFPETNPSLLYDYFSQPKTIHVTSTPNNYSQVKLAGDILEHIPAEERNETAIILGDEKLLVPMLNSMPPSVKEMNITMGFPVTSTPVYSLIEQIIALHQNSRQENNQYLFHHKHILKILNHQYLLGQSNHPYEKIVHSIHTQNKIYLAPEELHVDTLTKNLFRPVNNYNELSTYLQHFFQQLLQYPTDETNQLHLSALDKEYIIDFYKSINLLQEILNDQDTAFSISMYKTLLKKVLLNRTIPFTGEPLAGVQIMGLIETRALDFKHVIMLSVNEGSLPHNSAASSFIPYHLRKAFEIPTIEHQDAIFSYYFFRLLQRAVSINLIYHTDQSALKKGEKSRYIYQLEYSPFFNIESQRYVPDIMPVLPKEITIPKSEKIFNKLKSYTDNKFLSPSALNTYLNCPLQFYFRYIAGLYEEDEIQENIDAGQLGNIIHQVLEILYQPFVNKKIKKEDFTSIKNKLQSAIDRSFQEHYFKENKIHYSGKNLLIRRIVERYTHLLLKQDQKIAPFNIIQLEAKEKMPVTLNNEARFSTVNIGGFIDRIDKINNQTRIIDYKTGKTTFSAKNINSLFNDHPKRPKELFQILLYAMIYEYNHDEQYISPCIYSFRDIQRNQFEPGITINKEKIDNMNADIYNEMRDHLTDLLTQIFNPEEPFYQTSETAHCKFCPYSRICHR